MLLQGQLRTKKTSTHGHIIMFQAIYAWARTSEYCQAKLLHQNVYSTGQTTSSKPRK